MQPKRSDETGFFSNKLFILVAYIFFIFIIFIVRGQTYWIFFVFIFLIITVISSMFFWQKFALPNLSFSQHLILAKKILISQITGSPLILPIKNGEIEGDYLYFKKKPEIIVLNIDHTSAVLIKDISHQNFLLLKGVHVFNNNPKITGIFSLGMRCLQLGPRDRTDLGPKKSDESLADFHFRKNSAELTKTRLATGELIYPSFTIFYKITPYAQSNLAGMQFQRIYDQIAIRDTDLVSTIMIDEFIKKQLLNKWNTLSQGKSREEILSEFPAPVELSLLDEYGINYRITLDQIY